MSEYLPRYAPADMVPAVTSAAVTGGQLLVVSGDNTVAASSAAAIGFGVAANDAGSGERVTVYRTGIHVLGATGTINAGDPVVPAATGTVAALGNTTYVNVVGQALAAASGGKVTVALRIS